jgi:ABC-2 type transport system permease protein
VGDRVVASWHDYRVLASARLRSDWQYRTGFLLRLIAQILVTALEFAGVWAVFTNVDALGGWSFAQVAFLYGCTTLSFGLADFTVGSVERLAVQVRDGSFDRLLTRPVNVLVNLTASDFQFRRLGRVIQGCVVLIAAIVIVEIDWTVGRVVMIPLMVVSGTAIAGATWVATASSAFWMVNTNEIANTFTYGGELVTSYPLNIFDTWIRVLLTYIVPLVFVGYLPALYVLDITTPLALPQWLAFASPLVAVAAAAVARAIWRRGLRRYQSTGS